MEYILTILGYINPFKIISFFRRPMLEIYYDASETYHKAIDVSFNNIMGNFGHVMVKNMGKTTAKNCMGKLQSIDEFKDNKFQAIRNYKNIMTLKWAHEKKFLPKDIEPGYPVRLDLCYVHKDYDIIHFFTEKYPSGNQTDFPPGIYKVKIKVSCDNAKSTEKFFIVELQSNDFKSLKISNVKI